MLHEPNASLARRGKLQKLFRYVEILIKTHEHSTICKYISQISGMKVEKQEKKLQNEGKNCLTTANYCEKSKYVFIVTLKKESFGLVSTVALSQTKK